MQEFTPPKLRPDRLHCPHCATALQRLRRTSSVCSVHVRKQKRLWRSLHPAKALSQQTSTRAERLRPTVGWANFASCISPLTEWLTRNTRSYPESSSRSSIATEK